MSQAQMAELFQTTPQNITLHLKALYEEGEINRAATSKDFLQVQTEGKRSVHRTVLQPGRCPRGRIQSTFAQRHPVPSVGDRPVAGVFGERLPPRR